MDLKPEIVMRAPGTTAMSNVKRAWITLGIPGKGDCCVKTVLKIAG
jgi:hypothetical protein